jgi:KaiC/GvpD/RAD55 family RecA-like ATPase/tetratricopeptide (TPR) repeat protein
LKSRVLAEPILVGREHELEELQLFLDSAVAGKGATVFVSGRAGTGKTRLVNEFLNSARQKNETAVLTGWCLSNADVPYFPFIEAFSAYYSTLNEKNDYASPQQNQIQASSGDWERVGNEESDLNSWLKMPEKSGSTKIPGYLSPQALKDQTFAAVTKALLGISLDRPIVLFIDDLHWADSASLALLHYISRFIVSRRVLVLATFRSEDLNPDSQGHPHPLVEALRLMGRENLFKEVKLSSLDRTDVSLLAENMIGGHVQSELAEKLASESQGNPLFVVESLRMLSEKGSLVQENNRWRLSIDELGIPNKIKDIILRRVEVLKPNQRKLLDLASVIGAKFDPELLGVLLGQDVLEVLESLSGIAKSTSLVICEGNYYRFDHAKCRDTLYEEISPLLRKAYHGRIAEKLEAGWKDKKLPLSDLAFHYSQAENREKAIKFALAAGEEALSLFCGTEAINHFKYVLEATADAIGYADERATALEGLGDGLYARARCADATKVFEQLSSSAKSDLVRLRALRKAMYTAALQGDLSHARKLAVKAVENPQLDRLENARVHMNKGIITAYVKGRKEALPLIEESLRIFEEEYSLPDVAEALIWFVSTFGADGQLENALAAALRSCELAEYMRDLNKQHIAHTYLDIGFMVFGLLREAQESNLESFKIAEKVSDPISLAWEESIGYWAKTSILQGMAQERLISGFSSESMGNFGTGTKIKFFLGSLFSGALSEFKRSLKAAVIEALKGAECAEQTDSSYAQAINYTELVKLYAELGDMEQSEKYHQKMAKLISETSIAEIQYVYSGWLFSEAVFFSSKRQWKEANQFYEEFLEREKKTGEPPLAFQAALRLSYGMALLQQKRFAEAKLHFEEAKRIMDNLENRFAHFNIQAHLIAPIKVEVGKDFNMRLDIVNVAKNSGVLLRVEGLVPADFKVTDTQPHFDVQQCSIDMEKKTINSFRDQAMTLTVQATKEGTFNLNPRVIYLDDLGETKTFMSKPVIITAQPAKPAFEAVPGRVSTGFHELDKLLFGGIPENYAVILTSSSTDESQILIKRFLDAGVKAGEITFYITEEPNKGKSIAEQYPSTFQLFICNLQADTVHQDLPNVFKLKGVESLTDIDIALMKAFRKLNSSTIGSKRICIEIVSDVLLQHHAINTRRWLGALLPTLKSEGFTILAVVDPQMHSAEEVQAIMGLFDGEIRVTERENSKGAERVLKIRKLLNQKYQENEIVLTKEKLSQ